MDSPIDQDKSEEKYIRIEEAAELLEADPAEISGLIKEGYLHAYRIGDLHLRVRKDQVSELKARWRINQELFPASRPRDRHVFALNEAGFGERLKDFWYFNDFYILTFIIIAALILLIASSQ